MAEEEIPEEEMIEEEKIPLPVLKERVKVLAQSKFSARFKDLIYDIASGDYTPKAARELAYKATASYGHFGDEAFARGLHWLAVLAEKYGSGIAKKVIEEILSST